MGAWFTDIEFSYWPTGCIVGLAGVYIIDDLGISFSKGLIPLEQDENSGK